MPSVEHIGSRRWAPGSRPRHGYRLEPDKPWRLEPECPNSLSALSDDQPHVGTGVPRGAVIVAEHCLDAEPRAFHAPAHLGHRDGPERQIEAPGRDRAALPLDVLLFENRQAAPAVLSHRLDERDMRAPP